MVFKRDRLRRFFRLSFMVGAFFLLVVSGRALAAATPVTTLSDEPGYVVPNDVQKLNQANDERNINNSNNFNSTISNPSQLIVPEGQQPGNGQVVGGDGAWETSFAGLIKNLEISAPRKTTITGANGETKTYYVYTPGAIGTTINLTAQLYGHPPASSVDYIADLIENMKHPFVPKAYAQGLGFSSLAPVLELWKLFRNVAYFFFVIIFLIVGFLIMIRARIGSQAAVTVQQILPQLVISLILVTFSYAIAGLLLDVMNILIFLVIGLFSSVFPGGVIQDVTLNDIAFRNDIFTNSVGFITKGLAGSVAGSMGLVVQNILINLGWTQWVTDVLKLGTNVVFTLILTAAILISMFRVFFALLQAYIGIFFSVIFAPIQLMLGALPGQNAFQKWIQGLLENLLVFPTIVLMIFIAYFFSKPLTTTSGGFSAPQLGSNQGPQGFAVYQSLIALGIILAMPEVIKIAKGVMKGQVEITPQQLYQNLAAGNQYAAPAVGGIGGALYGLGAGGIQGYLTPGTGGRLGSALSGAIYGTRKGKETVGGITRTLPSGFQRGMGVAKTVDRLRSGQLFDPDNIAKQLDALQKAQTKQGGTGTQTGGGTGATGGGGSVT